MTAEDLTAFPVRDMSGLTVLDVGCGNGRDLLDPIFQTAKARYGIDVNREAIECGKKSFPQLNLQVARAEALPFEGQEFDLVICRVSLPYTDIPVALRQIHRVLKPAGLVYLAMHDLRLHVEAVVGAVRDRAWKRLIDLGYVTFAGLVFSCSGRCLSKPWNGQYETFQTRARMSRVLRESGFTEISSYRKGRHWIIEARRA